MSEEHLVPFRPRLYNSRRARRLFEHPRRIGSHLVPTARVVRDLLLALNQADILTFETNCGSTIWQPNSITLLPVDRLEECLRGDVLIRNSEMLRESIIEARLFRRIVKVAAETIWDGLVSGRPLRVRSEDRISEMWDSFERDTDHRLDSVVASALCPVLARYLKHMPHTACEKWYTVDETTCYLLMMLANDRDFHGRSSLDNIWLATIDAIIINYHAWVRRYITR